MEHELNRGNVVIVAGFQGITDDMDVTTPDRILPGVIHHSQIPHPLFCPADALPIRLTHRFSGRHGGSA